MKRRKNLLLLLFGGAAYVCIELLFRGRSHWSMFVLGGGCFWLIGHLGRQNPRPWIPVQIIAGSAICTAGELLFGMLFNGDYSVWDYRALPMNYHGQISLVFSLLWIPVSFLAVLLFDWLDARL